MTQSKLYFNIIFNATTGISLDCQADVEQNDIGNVYTGITLIPSAYTVDSATISANSIHTLGIGIDISDLSNSGKRSFIENNVIAAGGDGIRSEMASVQVTGNDFGGTSGYCVHAIGEAPVLNANDWGARCRGRLLQEWYLTMSAFESSDPYGGGLWTAATDFEGTVKDPSGHLVFSGHSGDSPSIRANLTGFTDDRDGNRTWATDYFVTLMKPHTGAGSGEIVFVNNTDFQQDLWPRADLAVEDLALPEGRPRPGQTVPVEVTVVEDNTYDNAFKPFRRVQVLLSDGVFTIGEKTMDEVEPNSTATIDFAWYATGGIHTLTAVVDPNQFLAEAFEDNNALSREVSVNSPPEAVLDVSDTNPSVGQTVTFCSNRSTDDVGVARSLFDFGDGMDSGWTADSVVLHAYDRPGTFYAALKVADAEGAESELQIAPAIVVAPGPFGVSLTANASVLDTLVPVTLTAIVNGTYGVRARYLWDFGDGTSEAGVNASQVEHVFSRAGAFVVSLSVTGASGGNGTAETALTVRDRPPVADFSLLPQDPTVLTPVRFSSQSGDPDGVIVKWLWDFGDGGQSLEPSPTHLYTAHGNFTVTLTVQDDSGNWATVAAKVVRVRDLPPAAHARASATRISAGGTVRLDASMTVDPDDSASTLLFRWSSDDGWASTGESVVRQFERPGKYELTLTVTDGDGASSQDRVSVEVLPSNNTEPVQYRPLAVGLFAVAASLFGLSALLLKMARASKGKRL